MPEIVRTRDLVVFTQGGTFTPAITATLATSGWAGGQGLMWDDSPRDEYRVAASDGDRGGGFALWGSDEDADVLTGITKNQPMYGFIVLCFGSWLISTRTYEKNTLASGRTVPITYTEGDKLVWSNNGLFTNEDEWTVSGDARAPNLNYIGHVMQAPRLDNNFYLGVQTIL